MSETGDSEIQQGALTDASSRPHLNADDAIQVQHDHAPQQDPHEPVDALRREISEATSIDSLSLSREVSTLSTDTPDSGQTADTGKKKKKKRVGGIMFAETMVQEQIIKEDKEDLEQRRQHWKDIQVSCFYYKTSACLIF
jgi:hypothetical protein